MNVIEKCSFVHGLSLRVVDEDYGFSFELVAIVDPRLVSSVSFQCGFSMGLVAI